MRCSLRLLAALCLVACTLAGVADIEHIVVLMEENRSFDHMLGFLKRLNPAVNGLNGDEFNYEKPNDPTSPKVTVSADAPDTGPFDPDHGLDATTYEIFGQSTDGVPPTMDGFIAQHMKHGDQAKFVMQEWTAERLPVMYNLSQEFVLFDNWHCSVPGPTFPNRLFGYSATSYGSTDNEVLHLYPQPSVFERLEAVNKSWSVYFSDIPGQWLLEHLRTPERLARFHVLDQFAGDVKEGKLANFVWLEPKYAADVFGPATDQHPDHPVHEGERLYKHVYEVLRNSSYWTKTLFLITYDEHGGFYDHVPPPQGVPSPDDHRDKTRFNFTRLGVRIPTIAISPWVARGGLVHEPPPAQRPTADSHYDATSIAATVKKMWNTPSFLTRRDAWAGTFEHILTDTLRTDCPATLPDVPALTAEVIQQQQALPLNDLQRDLIGIARTLNGNGADGVETQGELSVYFRREVQAFLARNGAA